MKKKALGTLLLGGLLLGASTLQGTSVFAASNLKGETTVKAKTTPGDVILTVDRNIDFKEQPLSDEIDFKDVTMNYSVIDYSGTKDGYQLQAQLEDKDVNRVLTVEGKEISSVGNTTDKDGKDIPNAATEVVTQKTNAFGDKNKSTLSLNLKYKNVTEVKELTAKINWTLVKGAGSIQP